MIRNRRPHRFAPDISVTPRFVVSIVIMLCAVAMSSAQTPPTPTTSPDIPAGSFTVGDRRVDVTADDIARHHRIVVRRAQDEAPHRQWISAWVRRIHLAEAAAHDIVVSSQEFRDEMRRRHDAERGQWIVDGRLDPKRFLAFIRKSGATDVADYERTIREDMHIARVLDRLYPIAEPNEAALLFRREARTTRYLVSMLTFAPETLAAKATTSDDDSPPKDFAAWWQRVPVSRKKPLDRERPAVEAEGLYFRFADLSPKEFRERFEQRRPVIDASFADLTHDLEPTPQELYRMLERWKMWRQSLMAYLNDGIPANLTDEESFNRLRPHFIRTWKLLRYFGRAWKEMAALPAPVDMKAMANKYQLDYIRLPFAPVWKHVNHPLVPGLYPHALRKLEPGTIFEYPARPESPSSLFFAHGVAEQPGLHASIWKLVRAEEQRVLDAKAAWKLEPVREEFNRSRHWNDAREAMERFVQRLDRTMKEFAANDTAATAANSSTRDTTERRRARALERLQGEEIPDARLIGPFVLTPYRSPHGNDRFHGRLDKRVKNFLEREWVHVFGTPRTFQAGTVLAPTGDPRRKLGGLVRIDEAHPMMVHSPADDAMLLAETRRELQAEKRRERDRNLRLEYGWPRVAKRFKIESPKLVKMVNDVLFRKKQ